MLELTSDEEYVIRDRNASYALPTFIPVAIVMVKLISKCIPYGSI
jgi:hypothetical protein